MSKRDISKMKKATYIMIIIFLIAVLFNFNFSKTKQGVPVPILMYHSVRDYGSEKNDAIVSINKFNRDMRLLQNKGYNTIFLSDLKNYLKEGVELPPKPIVITFDDGYADNFTNVYPIIQEKKIKITIFPIGWSVGKSISPLNGKITPHFGFEDMSEMYASGLVDFQNHTYDLHNPMGLSNYHKAKCGIGVKRIFGESFKDYYKRFSADMDLFDILWTEKLGYKPKFIAYPYGAYSEQSEIVVRNHGYEGSLSVKKGVRRFDTIDDLWGMPRVTVTEDLRGQALLKAIGEF